MAAIPDSIQGILDTLPTKPGCYLMKNSDGKIIYVGKAVNLRKRVRSYFHAGGDGREKVAQMVVEIADIDWIVVEFRTGSPDPGNEPDQEAPAALTTCA